MSHSSLRRLQLDTSWGDLSIVGGSRAGEGTLILLPQLHLALDAGRAHRALPAMTTVLASHGHVDHVGGIAYWASQRQLQSMGPARLFAPRQIAPGLDELLALHARLEGGDPYEIEVIAVDDDGLPSPPHRIEIRVGNAPPVADFTHEDLGGGVILFDAAGSFDPSPEGRIVHVAWDFGDNTTCPEQPLSCGDATREAPLHRFPGPGAYTVTLVVIDDEGEIDRETREITVH